MPKGFSLFILLTSFLASSLISQTIDTTKISRDTTLSSDTSQISIVLKKRATLFIPTMQPLPGMKVDKQSISFNVSSQYKSTRPEEHTNWDALNKPPDRYDYPLQKENQSLLIPVTPTSPQKDLIRPLPLRNYVLPARAELDIFEILWAKEDVQDTTIYSCLDTILNITMADLNRLLDRMTNKGLVTRRIVSPRNEFNAFGILIEMSPQNRRNRVYEYHTLVDRNLMRTFIDANIFLFKHDSSIINRKHWEAVRKDSTLLKDLNKKISRIKEQ